MKSSAKKIELASVDDLFSTEEGRQDAKLEKIQEIPLSELHPFKNHPFKVKDDEAMMETADSIKQYGVLVPAIARPDPEGGYELVAGHRRHRASELADKETMPVIVRDLDDDAATIIMDMIRDSIENRADDVCRAKEELRTTPVYPHSAAYAREHGELEQYRASNNVNLQCKESIEAAVREHFDGMYLSHDAAKGVIETYGMERVSMVLSNTIQLQDWDGRYSRRNKEWAKTIPNDNPETVRCGYALNSHPAVLDGFIDLVREEQQRSRTQREKLEPSRPSVRDKLKQELPANKSAATKKRELER